MLATVEPPRSQRGFGACGMLLLVSALAGASGCHSKGPYRPWIHKVYFHGVRQIKEKDVRAKIAVQQSSWFPLLPKKYLDHPTMAEVDRERIATYYQTRGFFSTRVPKVEITTYKKNLKKPPSAPEYIVAVDVHYTVAEGEPTRITKVTIDGLDSLGQDGQSAIRRAISGLKVGERFEHEPYLVAKDTLVRQLQKRGYAFARIASADVAVDRDQRTAEIHLTADAGRKATIGEANIQGTVHVDAAALKKHAAVPTGDSYRPETLEGIQGRLYSLGLFSTVRVESVANTAHPEIADVQIAVSEGKHRELRLGVGFGIESLRTEVHAEALYTQRRFLGGLRTLQLTLQPGYAALPAVWSNPIYRHGPMLTFKADFTQPDVLGPHSALNATLSYDLGLEYAYQYHGPSLRLGVNRSFWDERIRLGVSYNFQFLDFFSADPSLLSDPQETGSRFGYVDPYRLGYLQEQVALDLRDRPVDARRGFYLALLAEQGGVYAGSAFDYQKLMPEARGYIPLGQRVIIAMRVMFGQIFVQGDLGSPITQRFYLGGPNSHRGFTYNRLSYQVCSGTPNEGYPIPSRQPCSADPSTFADFRRIPIGGDQMLIGQFELRVNLVRLFDNWLTLASFVDAGDVSAPHNSCTGGSCSAIPYPSSLDLTKLHVAVGGGLRYRTIVGTIRFDLGVRLNRLDTIEDGIENPDPGSRIAYHISIGESF